MFHESYSIRIFCLLVILWVLFVPSHPLVSRAESKNALADVTDTLLVGLPAGVSSTDAQALLASRGLEPIRQIPRINVWRVRPTTGERASVQAVRDQLSEEQVLWVERDGLVHAQGLVPNDPYYLPQQWNLRQIGMEQAWLFARSSPEVIAVIDTGIGLTHPDLETNLWTNTQEIPGNGLDDDSNGYIDDVTGWDWIEWDGTPQDGTGHGSHVAGIAGAGTDNMIGVAGTGWDVTLMPLRVLDSQGGGSWSDVAEAIIYAADNGARVINLSLGGHNQEGVETVRLAVEYAREQDSLLVAAAGNIGETSSILYPAALGGVVAVGATDAEDRSCVFSRRGPEMDVAAPGENIYSTYSSSGINSYTVLKGTSMATPHVSALAALIWHVAPSLTPAQVTRVITETAKDVHAAGWDQDTGWGRIDAQAAVLSLVQPELVLESSQSSILAIKGSATVTATVACGELPCPDGLTVSFMTLDGMVDPEASDLIGGQVTTTLSSDIVGSAQVWAGVGDWLSDPITVTVEPAPPFEHIYWFALMF